LRDEGDVAARSSADRLVLLLGAALLLAVTAVQVLPAAGRLGTHVMPNDGDPVLVTWIVEHQARALLDDPSTIYRANIFWPEPHAIAWSDNLTAFVPPYLALWLATGRDSVLAYNGLTFLAFGASALTVLLLARRLLSSPAAAVVAAVAFCLTAVRLSAIGHTQLAGFVFLPLALVAVMDLVERRRARTAVLVGLCLAGLWYTAIYHFVLAVVVVPAFAVLWAATHPREVDRRLLALAAGAAVVGGVLVAPSLPPYLDLQQRASFERSDDELLTIDPESFVPPPSAVYRALGREADPGEGADAFLGWTTAALAGVGVVGAAAGAARRRRVRPEAASERGRDRAWTPVDRRRHFALPLAVACTVGGLLALGPDDGALSAPYRALRPLVPGLESARALNRFWVLPALGVALLAGRGLELVVARRHRWLQAGVGAAVVVVLLLELLVRPGSSVVHDEPPLVAVNEVLGDLPEGVVTELPVPPLEDLAYVFAIRQLRSLRDGLPRVEGYSGDLPDGVGQYLEATSTFPSAEATTALRQAGVRHVVLHGAATPCVSRYGEEELAAVLDAAARSPHVETITEVGSDAIVTLVPAPRGGPLVELPSVAPSARSTEPCAAR
jgi:hypothetical protein